MKNSKLFITSLIAAAAMTFSAQAENINLSTTATELEKTTTAGQGNTYTACVPSSLQTISGVRQNLHQGEFPTGRSFSFSLRID